MQAFPLQRMASFPPPHVGRVGQQVSVGKYNTRRLVTETHLTLRVGLPALESAVGIMLVETCSLQLFTLHPKVLLC